jgi:hypothetical protein
MSGVPDWYSEWADDHRRAFMLSADWIDAAWLWWEVFAGLRATPRELAAATRDVQSLDNPPKFPGDHLPAVKAALGRGRNAAAAAARRRCEQEDDGRGVCADCFDTGWVVVPHPRWVVAGAWEPTRYTRAGDPLYVTATATCGCWKGRQSSDSLAARDLKHLTVEAYTNWLPDWRQQVARVRAAEKARRAAEEKVPATAAGIVGGLTLAFRPPGGNGHKPR